MNSDDDPMLKQAERVDRTGSESSADLESLTSEPEIGLLREFWEFLRTNKRWWLAPIVLSLLVFGLLVALSTQSAIGPWIYAFY
jgi:membrane glycosyltransferase